MCLLKVKEEQEYSVPVRVRRTKWTNTDYSSPPRTSYYSNTRVVEDRRVSSAPLPAPPPPPAPQSYYKESHSEYKASEAPAPSSVHPSHVVTESKHMSGTSRDPSTTSRTRSNYVEVEHEDDQSSASSSSASNDDVRSRTTHRTSKTSNTHRTSQTSKSRSTAPTSDYSVHEREREVRRERTYSRPRGEYQTYQYVNAPFSGSRSRDYDDPRGSSASYGRRSQQYYR